MQRIGIGMGFGFVLGIISGAFMEAYDSFEEQVDPIEITEELPIRLEQPEFFLEDAPTIELVTQACKYYGIQHEGIVTAQAILETGYFKSNICKTYNNLFGLYNSYKKDYFKFNHWTESVKAYKDLVQYRYNYGDYYNWLQQIGYAEDPMYISKVKKIQNRHNL